jgi:hypothetical protein
VLIFLQTREADSGLVTMYQGFFLRAFEVSMIVAPVKKAAIATLFKDTLRGGLVIKMTVFDFFISNFCTFCYYF